MDFNMLSLMFCFRAFLTEGMKYNLKLILFWGPGSPFQNNWKLREEYRNPANRSALYNWHNLCCLL